ncbi:MAG: hypothetical protein WBD64_05355, partial [Candidatus Zixiibacteriota bacterium]
MLDRSAKELRVTLTARPLRLAFYLEEADPHEITQVVLYNCTVWGGIYNPIIIRRGRTNKELQGLLALFDPDLCVGVSGDVLAKADVPHHRMVDFGWLRASTKTVGCDISVVVRHLFETRFRFQQRYPARALLLDKGASKNLCDVVYFGGFPNGKPQEYAENYQTVFEPKTIQGLGGWKLKDSPARALSPLAVTAYRLRTRAKFHYRPMIFVFNGEDPEDCVDFWNLRALGLSVFGLPVQCVSNWRSSLPRYVAPYTAGWTCKDAPELAVYKSRRIKKTEFLRTANHIESVVNGVGILRNISFPRLASPEYWHSDNVGPNTISSLSQDLEIHLGGAMLRWRSIAPQFAQGRTFPYGILWANDV